MYEKRNSQPFGLLFLLVILGVAALITSRQDRHSKQSIAAHPEWAVAYFDKFTAIRKTRYAQYHFRWKGKTYYASASKEEVMDLGQSRYTTCFPVVFDSTDIDNSEVILRKEQLDDLHIALPDSIALLVTQTTHDQRLAANHYPFPTALKEGYALRYDFDNIREYLSLLRGTTDTIKKQLVSAEFGSPFVNLGYVIADYRALFLIAHAADSVSPRPIELFDKSTGDNKIAPNACFIGTDTIQNILIYYVPGGNTSAQHLFLYDVNRQQERKFPYPANAIEHSIRLTGVTDNTFTLTYNVPNGKQEQKLLRP